MDKKMYPVISGAAERLRKLCFEALEDKFDDKEKEAAREYLEKELHALDLTGGHFIFLQIKELMQKAGLRKYDVSIRGTAAGSMVAYLLDISEVDPIKLDLKPETIYLNRLNREIDIDLNIPAGKYDAAHALLKTLEGVGRAIDIEVDGELAGTYLLPEDCDPSETLTIKKQPNGDEIVYYDSFFLLPQFYKADLKANVRMEVLSKLAERTGVDPADVPYYSDEVIAMFRSNEGGGSGSFIDLPDFASDRVKSMIRKLKPESFDDLVKLFSLVHGTGVWEDNGEKLFDENGIGIKELISDRDDISDYLLSLRIDRMKAFDISEYIRKGKALLKRPEWSEYKKVMLEAGAPEWYAGSCEKIKYLFPRAHAAAYMIKILRQAWYRLNYPEEYRIVAEKYEL